MLKAVVSCALIPLFTVVIGGGTLMLITPLIQTALLDSNEVATRGTVALFLAACVYCALMVMVTKVTGTIVSNWRLPFFGEPRGGSTASPMAGDVSRAAVATVIAATPMAASAERVRAMVAALPAPVADMQVPRNDPAGAGSRDRRRRPGAAARACRRFARRRQPPHRRRREVRFAVRAATLPRGHLS